MRNFVVVLMLLAGMTVQAEEAAGPWSGSAALGILATSGNSDTSSSHVSLKLSHHLGQWQHDAEALAAGASAAGITTAERYTAGYKAKRDFTEHDYLFAHIGYEKDKFSGYDLQTTESLGYGRRLVNQANHVLNLEAGAGFKQTELRDMTTRDSAIVSLGGDYLWKFGPTAQFTQTLDIQQGAGNTYLEAVSAIRANLVKQLGLIVSYTAKNNSKVPVGSKKTDTFTSISLEYAF